jgi:hypothetical protein
MSGTAEAGFPAVMAAIAASRRAQARQYALIREILAHLVTRDEFSAAMTSLANALDAIDADHETVSAMHTQQLAELLRRAS